MSGYLSYSGTGSAAPGRTHTLFGQTMGYVAVTAGLFALGSYLGRNLSYGWAFVWFIAAFACLIGMNFAVRRSGPLTTGLLARVRCAARAGDGADPRLLREREPAGRCGRPAAPRRCSSPASGRPGYATRRDLSGIARLCFWALIALIVFGIVMIFVRIPHGSLIYSVLGLVIFAGLTMFDFQRLRRSKRPRLRAADRRVDLPRRAERVPVLPADLLQRQQLTAGAVSRRSPGGLCKTLGFQDQRSWEPQVSAVEQDHKREFCITLPAYFIYPIL